MAAHPATGRRRAWLAVKIALIVIMVAGLTVDGYVHVNLASNYELIKTSTLSQADLFRVEAAVAIVAALLLVVRPRRYTAAIAAVVAGSALSVLLLYRYTDIGPLGPIPSMYEPIWYTKKIVAAFAEGAALTAAVVLLFVLWGQSAPSVVKPASNRATAGPKLRRRRLRHLRGMTSSCPISTAGRPRQSASE